MLTVLINTDPKLLKSLHSPPILTSDTYDGLVDTIQTFAMLIEVTNRNRRLTFFFGKH